MKVLYAIVALWALYNVSVVLTCDGDTSPFYWPPVTQCRR